MNNLYLCIKAIYTGLHFLLLLIIHYGVEEHDKYIKTNLFDNIHPLRLFTIVNNYRTPTEMYRPENYNVHTMKLIPAVNTV